MRRILAFAVIGLASTGAASAADLGTSVEPVPVPVAASSGWATRFGVAFDTYYVDEANNDEGTDSDGFNLGGHVDMAAGKVWDGGRGVQFDLRGSAFVNNHQAGDDDWTQSYLTGAVHLFMPTNAGGIFGAFAGTGITNDTGDTDEIQNYWFAGLEGRKVNGNRITFGQLGYLDGNDEYDEGINTAGFARLGTRVFTKPNVSYMAAISGAYGRQDNGDEANDHAIIGNLELEAEYAFGNGATSVFAQYQGTYVSFDGGMHGADFHDFMIGFRWRPGATDLQSAYSSPASLDLAPVDRWFSLTANEVE